MSTWNTNKEFVVSFFKNLTSTKESSHDEVLEQMQNLFMILGYERMVTEALPIITFYLNFMTVARIQRFINELVLIDFELKKPLICESLSTFFFSLLEIDDIELRTMILKKLAHILTFNPDPINLQNFFLKLYADTFPHRRMCIFELMRLISEDSPFFKPSKFFIEFFEKLTEEPHPKMKKRSLKLMFEIAEKHSSIFPPAFFNKIWPNIKNDKNIR